MSYGARKQTSNGQAHKNALDLQRQVRVIWLEVWSGIDEKYAQEAERTGMSDQISLRPLGHAQQHKACGTLHFQSRSSGIKFKIITPDLCSSFV